MTVTLPYPPPLNNLYFTRGRHRVLSDKGRAFKQAAAIRARIAGMRPVSCEVAVAIDIYRPRRAGDLDGYLKACLDALTGIAWVDDKQVVQITARRFDDKHNPRAVVTVSLSPLAGSRLV